MKSINTYYFNSNNNFGDILNIDILTKLLGIDVSHVSPEKAELVCIGSLLESFLHGSGNLKLFVKKALYPNLKIWGTGFIDKEDSRIKRPNNLSETFSKSIEVYALRGSLTRSRIEKMLNKDLSTVTLGDPGLLASKLNFIDYKIPKKYKIGLIPHYVDKANPLVTEFIKQNQDCTVIDILTDPKTFLSKVMECESVLSSAMHGLIAADSLNIPNQRVLFSNLIAGGDYKFKDYYSAFGLDLPKLYDFRTDKIKVSSTSIRSNYNVDFQKVKKIQTDLLKSFPSFN